MYIGKVQSCVPLIFHVDDAKFDEVTIFAFMGHGGESSGAEHEIRLIICIEISHNHRGPSRRTKLWVLTSYLHQPITFFFKKKKKSIYILTGDDNDAFPIEMEKKIIYLPGNKHRNRLHLYIGWKSLLQCSRH